MGQELPDPDSTLFYSNTRKPILHDSAVIEYAPSIQADGKKLIFEADFNSRMFRSYESVLQPGGSWSKPVPLERINASVDSTELLGGPSISFDGNLLFFFRSIGFTGNHDIYYSVRQKDGWGVPANIGPPINTDGYEAFPSISADGTELYFIAQNKEGPKSREIKRQAQFCTSIYRSVKGRDGTWGKPEKLPYPINQDCEKAPRIMADGKTLIFSSNRPGGAGDYDLYLSRLTELGTWSPPVPLAFVNTPESDHSASISAQGDLLYYTYANKDIYSVKIPHRLRQFMNNILDGHVIDRDTRTGIGVDIIVTDALTSEVVMQLTNNEEDGRYTTVLPVGRSFNIEFAKEGYSSFLYALDLRDVKKYQEIDLDIELFKTVDLDLTVSDKELFEPIAANVKVGAKGNQPSFSSELKTDHSTGKVRIELPIGARYEIQVDAPNYKSESLDLDLSALVMYHDFQKYLELVPEKKQVMVNVEDLQNNSKVKSRVVLRNKDRDEVIEVSGNQMVSLRAGDRYEIEITSDQGYAFESGVLDLTKGGTGNITFKLQKLELDALLTLKDINFESNSAKLTDESNAELSRVVKLLKENLTLKVEIAAHTDDIGSDTYNHVLSEKRAQSVVGFIVQNNVKPERFVAKGYGERTPKAPNDSEENRAKNRRVELKIIGI